jgi:hypothetical protein
MNGMKTRFGKVSLVLTGLALMTTATAAFAQGTIYVEQVGQTGSTTALSSAGTALFLDQFTTSGTAIGTALNLTTAGANTIVDSGTATSEGVLTQSGNYLTFVGYDTAVGTAGVATGTANRGVGVYNITTGLVDDTTSLTDAYLGNNIRSATTTNGVNIFTSGTAASASVATGGVRSTTDGSSTTTAQETLYTNTRYVESYNGNTYFSTGTGSGIYELNGTATPTTVVTAASIASPYAFVFANGGTTLYVADSTNGIEKFTSTGGVFSSTATETFNVTGGGISGLAFGGTDSAGNNILYAVNGLTGSSTLLSLDDTGTNASLTTLLTAPTNTAFRGVAYIAAAPEPSSVAAMAIGIGALGLLVARRRKVA